MSSEPFSRPPTGLSSDGIALLIVTADRERFAAAIAVASAAAALGRRASVYLHDGAVALLARPSPMLTEAMTAGVRCIACQTGLAAAGITFDDLQPGIEAGGLVSFLAELGDDRLLAF